MNATPTTWPICPRPKPDESLHSWVERIGHEYMMTPALLVGAICLSDLGNDKAPYGRQTWQQSWCTVCLSHGTALTLRNIRITPKNQSAWSRKKLTGDWQFLAANRYRGLKVTSQPQVRATVLGCLLEIEKATKAAIAGIAPNSWSWGSLAADEFLLVLKDLTTWTLTHFEPVRSWSIAEDLTPTEEQEGYGLIGRTHRMSGSNYRDDSSTRTLRDVTNPKVRGAALWSTG